MSVTVVEQKYLRMIIVENEIQFQSPDIKKKKLNSIAHIFFVSHLVSQKKQISLIYYAQKKNKPDVMKKVTIFIRPRQVYRISHFFF